MLVIREEQMQSLKLAAMKSFEQRMVDHLRQWFPNECERAGEQRLRDAIRQGVERSASYKIVNELDVARYLELSVALGLDFDNGNRYPWVAQILNDATLLPGAKIQLLRNRAEREAARGLLVERGSLGDR